MSGVQITSPLQAHRRPAAGHRRAGQRLQGGQSIPDFTRGYGFRQDIYDGECHSGIAEADAGHRPQQDACGAALRRIQGDVPGECGGVFCVLIWGQGENRIISCYLVLIVPYFVDKMGDYGRNNTRRTGGVCDLDSCNG